MKTLYIECKMGIAGDMFASALLDLFEDSESVVRALNDIGIPKVRFELARVQRCHIEGNQLSVLIDGMEEFSNDIVDDGHHMHSHDHEHEHHNDNEHEHSHAHTTIYDIEEIIEELNISKEIKSDIREIYQLLAEAESSVHGEPVSQIHFHEVGNFDAIADITAVCYLMHELDPDKVIVSPINVGGGQVKCAHGILPVPTPATAFLLKGIPSYSSDRIKAELCTPTGAALIKYFAFDFGTQPVMSVSRIGYGMGKKDFEQSNCVRIMLGEINEEAERIVELSCNIDDMTPEELGFAKEMLFETGAIDVYSISADMKKDRPGILLTCICREDKKDELIKCMFRHTTTLGLRESISNRYTLSRQIDKVETPYGEVRIKRALGYEINRAKLEYDDLAGIAKRTGKSLISLKKEIEELIYDEKNNQNK